MSLKNFHILFITISALLGLGFGIWSLQSYNETDELADLAMGTASFIAAVALIIYGVKFRRKIRERGL